MPKLLQSLRRGRAQSVHPSSPAHHSGHCSGWATKDNTLSGPFAFLLKESVQCWFEGGARCRREDPAAQAGGNAIEGLHSNWVNSSVLAMARPWQHNILKHGLVAQFQEQDIGLIVNLQEVGEHSGCGPRLLPNTGFTYDPETWMAGKISFCNFSWRDMGTPDLNTMTSITQGSTSPEEAVKIVRFGRPGALQTAEQVRFVAVFAAYLQQLRCLFWLPKEAHSAASCASSKALEVSQEQGDRGRSAELSGTRRCLHWVWRRRRLRKSNTLSLCDRHRLWKVAAVALVPPSQLRWTLAEREGGDGGSESMVAVCVDSPEGCTDVTIQLQYTSGLQDVKLFRPWPPMSLVDAVKRQRRLLHGPDRRKHWNVPQIVLQIASILQQQIQTFDKARRASRQLHTNNSHCSRRQPSFPAARPVDQEAVLPGAVVTADADDTAAATPERSSSNSAPEEEAQPPTNAPFADAMHIFIRYLLARNSRLQQLARMQERAAADAAGAAAGLVQTDVDTADDAKAAAGCSQQPEAADGRSEAEAAAPFVIPASQLDPGRPFRRIHSAAFAQLQPTLVSFAGTSEAGFDNLERQVVACKWALNKQNWRELETKPPGLLLMLLDDWASSMQGGLVDIFPVAERAPADLVETPPLSYTLFSGGSQEANSLPESASVHGSMHAPPVPPSSSALAFSSAGAAVAARRPASPWNGAGAGAGCVGSRQRLMQSPVSSFTGARPLSPLLQKPSGHTGGAGEAGAPPMPLQLAAPLRNGDVRGLGSRPGSPMAGPISATGSLRSWALEGAGGVLTSEVGGLSASQLVDEAHSLLSRLSTMEQHVVAHMAGVVKAALGNTSTRHRQLHWDLCLWLAAILGGGSRSITGSRGPDRVINAFTAVLLHITDPLSPPLPVVEDTAASRFSTARSSRPSTPTIPARVASPSIESRPLSPSSALSKPPGGSGTASGHGPPLQNPGSRPQSRMGRVTDNGQGPGPDWSGHRVAGTFQGFSSHGHGERPGSGGGTSIHGIPIRSRPLSGAGRLPSPEFSPRTGAGGSAHGVADAPGSVELRDRRVRGAAVGRACVGQRPDSAGGTSSSSLMQLPPMRQTSGRAPDGPTRPGGEANAINPRQQQRPADGMAASLDSLSALIDRGSSSGEARAGSAAVRGRQQLMPLRMGNNGAPRDSRTGEDSASFLPVAGRGDGSLHGRLPPVGSKLGPRSLEPLPPLRTHMDSRPKPSTTALGQSL